MALKSDPNFEEKLTFCLKNDIRILMNFNQAVKTLKICTLMGFFLSKVCNVSAKIIQTSCVIKNDLWFQKCHKKFGELSNK